MSPPPGVRSPKGLNPTHPSEPSTKAHREEGRSGWPPPGSPRLVPAARGQRGPTVVARGAQAAAMVGVVGIEASGHELGVAERVVVGGRRRRPARTLVPGAAGAPACRVAHKDHRAEPAAVLRAVRLRARCPGVVRLAPAVRAWAGSGVDVRAPGTRTHPGRTGAHEPPRGCGDDPEPPCTEGAWGRRKTPCTGSHIPRSWPGQSNGSSSSSSSSCVSRVRADGDRPSSTT